METMPSSRSVEIRALRGVVLNCLRPMRKRWEDVGPFPDRRCVPYSFQYEKKKPGCCRWCRLPVKGRKHWHRACGLMFTACSGSVSNIYGTPVIPVQSCETCGAAYTAKRVPWHLRFEDSWKDQDCFPGHLELDHRIAISVARTKGPDAFVRAFLPGNLRWLCGDCHKEKTKLDRKELAAIKRSRRTTQKVLKW